ncbi:hypothetical protein BDV12DRAFT_198571 [Aspergillus spectabilis]
MDPGLLSLPTELLLEIFRLIPTISKHAFSLSSHRLRHEFTPLCPTLSIVARYEIRALLARDGVPFRDYAYSSGCCTVHMWKFFPPEQLDLPPTIRFCSASQRQLWVAPGQFLTFQDAQKQRDFWHRAYPDDLPSLYQNIIMPLFSNANVWRYTGDRQYVWYNIPEQFAVCASYEVLSMPGKKSANKEIERILRGFDIPTCPHTRLGNGSIAASYQESRHCIPESDEKEKIWIGQMQTDGADASCEFPGCKTVFSVGVPAQSAKEWMEDSRTPNETASRELTESPESALDGAVS